MTSLSLSFTFYPKDKQNVSLWPRGNNCTRLQDANSPEQFLLQFQQVIKYLALAVCMGLREEGAASTQHVLPTPRNLPTEIRLG